MTSRKILYLYHGKLTGVGIDLVVRQQVLALAEVGHAVTLVSRGEVDHENVTNRRIAVPLAAAASLVSREWYDGLKRRTVLRRAERELHHGHYDAVITWNGLAFRLVAPCEARGIPLFINCGNLAKGQEWDDRKPSRWPTVGRYERRWEYAKSDAIVVATSDFARATFLRAGLPEHRVESIGRGVDLSRFHPSPKQKAGGLRVLFCGRLSERKGIFEILAAWERAALGDGRLLLAGSVPKELEARIRDWAERLGNVEILGFRRDLPAIMQRCDVQVLLSYSEGQAKSLLEGAACGLVTIATAATGFPHSPAYSFVAEREDTGAVAGLLRGLAEDPERLRKMGEAAAAFVRQNYSWERFRERFREMLDSHLR